MIIRKQQMEAFDRAALRAFEDEMVRHLEQFAPRHSQVIGEAGVRDVIRLGIGRAGRYLLTDRGAVRFYIDMMFMYGSDFDSDPLMPWAGQILGDPAIAGPVERVGRLYDRTLAYIARVAGPNNEYAIAALRRIHAARAEDYPVSRSDFEEIALRALREIYPQKCEEAGEPALRGLIRRGVELSRRHSAATDTGASVFISLMFALGHGFATDPLFPWVSGVLNNQAVADPGKRVERLSTRARTYLGEVLAYLERR